MLNKFSIIGYIALVASIILFFMKPDVKTVVRIEKEIKVIQLTRIKQTILVDKKIADNNKKTDAKIKELKKKTLPELKQTIDSLIPVDSSNSEKTDITKNQLEQCLEYKFKFERDSVNLLDMTKDRNECNSQLNLVVEKVDTLVIASKKESSQKLKQGLSIGFLTGILVSAITIITVVVLN